MILVFQNSIRHSQSQLAEMQEDARNGGTILSVANVVAWIETVTELISDNGVFGINCQKMYADSYDQNLLKTINPLLGPLRCIVKPLNPDELHTKKEHGNYPRKEKYHSLNVFRSYIHYQCTILSLQVYCSNKPLDQGFCLLRY